MKKASLLFFFLVFGVAFTSFGQTAAPTDFYAGKWEIAVAGTPNGDVKFTTDLVRKDGKLTGELVNPDDKENGKRPITKVVENGDKISIYFDSVEAGELSIDLDKVDNDNLKGNLYNFETVAKRIK